MESGACMIRYHVAFVMFVRAFISDAGINMTLLKDEMSFVLRCVSIILKFCKYYVYDKIISKNVLLFPKIVVLLSQSYNYFIKNVPFVVLKNIKTKRQKNGNSETVPKDIDAGPAGPEPFP